MHRTIVFSSLSLSLSLSLYFTHAWHAAMAQVSYSNNVCSPRRFTCVPQLLANEVISPLVF
ncbi:hypothetical protein BKA82DRAFT_1004127 [Pisolithus tinctorius]|uniref:Secreted protein n=1 Tax=Pisolithus tinctorius Marx 270 TaxID=870435 RepID=A0A0C3NGN1_PISTI|nr:hypothetical protein BKA82DRAFT_1004127 [Pisolithus tinctorius]KIO00210.1 hypothetical protein M404DRAFT_1004127 [Pisolithus tinctorius Marx 270]